MWPEDKDQEFNIFREMEREADRIIDEAYSDSINWLFDLSRKSVKPLHRIDIVGRELYVSIDLPGVMKHDVTVSVSGEYLNVEAKMKRPMLLMVGGTFQEKVQFEKYWKRIKLPVKVDVAAAKAKMRNGILTIIFPILEETGTRKTITID